jgi:hypothetical protein
MSSFIYRGFLSLSLVLSAPLSSWEITLEEAEAIGKQIFFNECSGKPEKLVWWNDGEDFASLGIGHFIWYPEGEKEPFEETFPAFLTFLNARDIQLPDWLTLNSSCLWHSKQELFEKSQEKTKNELQAFLFRTISLQTVFIAKRFEQSLTDLFSDLNEDRRKPLLRKIELIAHSPHGKYALIDYLNFKGKGTSPKERYKRHGWGLRQVLEEMPENTANPLTDFAETAKTILKRRVQNSPPERREERWLPGWLNRIDSYTNNTNADKESS